MTTKIISSKKKIQLLLTNLHTRTRVAGTAELRGTYYDLVIKDLLAEISAEYPAINRAKLATEINSLVTSNKAIELAKRLQRLNLRAIQKMIATEQTKVAASLANTNLGVGNSSKY